MKYFKLNDNGTYSLKAWREFWNGLTINQQEFIKSKAEWEHYSLTKVAAEWGVQDE